MSVDPLNNLRTITSEEKNILYVRNEIDRELFLYIEQYPFDAKKFWKKES